MKEIKRKVRRFRREYNIRSCTLPALTQAFEKQGFTIIWFNPVLNDKDVETVVHALGLEERIARSNGFIYIDRNYRLLFVNESLTDQEKILVMAHVSNSVLPREWCFMRNPGFLAETKKERYRKAPLPRKTSYVTRVALQHCPALHMSKRKFMVPKTGIICQ